MFMEAFFKITCFVGMCLEIILRVRYDRQRREVESRTVALALLSGSCSQSRPCYSAVVVGKGPEPMVWLCGLSLLHCSEAEPLR